MEATTGKSVLNGTVNVPASKSHTIRAIIIAALAHGRSVIKKPLDSLDTRSAADAARAFGARIEMSGEHWTVEGVEGIPWVPEDVINVGNSGTTLYFATGTAALVDGWTVITGDGQIRRRSAAPLINALGPLGADVFSSRGNGMAPLLIRGKMTGGMASISGVSSQYVSSLLLACPLALGDTELIVTVLNERPYVQMTLNWLAGQGIVPKVSSDMSTIRIKGRQSYTAFEKRVPADFSSAAFPLCAGVLSGGTVILKGLELNDPQGDKEIIYILQRMGAFIEINHNTITVHGSTLRGIDVDMNSIPDALPIMAVCACFAEGTTALYNVPQARIKETDRISVMAQELRKLGADINELPDGLIIKGKGLKGGKVHGHGDHRVVMALTVAGFAADGPVTVDTAETASVTYPGFWDVMKSLGGNIWQND